MSTLRLAHLVAVHPRGKGLRKRQPRKLKPIRPSRKNELWYRAELSSLVGRIKAATAKHILPVLAPKWPAVTDGVPPEFSQAIDAAARSLGRMDVYAKKLADAATMRNLREVDERLGKEIQKSVSVNVRGLFSTHGKISQSMDAATEWNVSLIKSIPSQYFEKIETLVSDAWARGERHEAIISEIEHLGDVTESRARLIARDQTSKMNSAFNQVRQTSVGIAKYVWQTSDDERVRESHADMDGEECSWDSPPMVDDEAVHPGEAIQCRCTAIPVFDLDEVEADLGITEAA